MPFSIPGQQPQQQTQSEQPRQRQQPMQSMGDRMPYGKPQQPIQQRMYGQQRQPFTPYRQPQYGGPQRQMYRQPQQQYQPPPARPMSKYADDQPQPQPEYRQPQYENRRYQQTQWGMPPMVPRRGLGGYGGGQQEYAPQQSPLPVSGSDEYNRYSSSDQAEIENRRQYQQQNGSMDGYVQKPHIEESISGAYAQEDPDVEAMNRMRRLDMFMGRY